MKTMGKATLSIIIPAYNAAPYINDCIGSIMASTYRDFELLLVDDGSTDGTSDLCDQLAERYPVIKVFHTENRGLSSARNLGIDSASGKYIGFVDADDYISSSMFEVLVKALNETDADMAVCGYQRCQKGEVRQASSRTDIAITAERAEIAQEVLCGGYGCYVWNKLFQKKILDENRVTFRIDCGIAEDQYFIMEYLQYCKKAVFIDTKLYFYVMNGASLMNSFRNSRFVDQRYLGLPRSWRYTESAVRDVSKDLSIYARARASMFYQTVLRKLEEPETEYINEAVAYVKQNKTVLCRYRWGWKYYLSAVILSMSYPLWAAIFRRSPGNVRSEEVK